MNERIKELVNTAFIQVDGPEEEHSLRQPLIDNMADVFEKFAELIVRECAYIPIDMWDKAELNADVAVKIEDRIKQHFGVEE